MKIGIDISQIVYEGTGVARFTTGLCQAIISNKTEDWVFFYSTFRRKVPEQLIRDIRRSGYEIIFLPFPPSLLNYIWNTVHTLPITKLIHGLDWFITSDWTEPPAKCKKATIVHDLAFKRYPETIDPVILSTMEKRFNHLQAESDLIFTDSFSTKQDLLTYYQIPEHRIHVNYPGVQIVTPTEDAKDIVAKKYQIAKPFILTVGKIEPRKNLIRLIEAFTQLNRPDIELVIVGPDGWDKISRNHSNIRFLGFVPDEDLPSLYTLSCGFVLASLWEGFGYPVLEAMLLNKPVAVSNRSSLAEITKDVGIQFDPEDISAIKIGLEQLTKKVPQEQISKAYDRAGEFNWQTYYTRMITALRNNT